VILTLMLSLAFGSAPAAGAECGVRPTPGLASYFSNDDYPASAVRHGEEGRVEFCLQVGRNGLVASCTILSSSGFADLDEAACRIARERVRFVPAHDARGNAVEDRVRGAVRWVLPHPAPIAALPRT
jgi:protein TonB